MCWFTPELNLRKHETSDLNPPWQNQWRTQLVQHRQKETGTNLYRRLGEHRREESRAQPTRRRWQNQGVTNKVEKSESVSVCVTAKCNLTRGWILCPSILLLIMWSWDVRPSTPGGKVHFSSSIFLWKLRAFSWTLFSLSTVSGTSHGFLGGNFSPASPANLLQKLQCDVPHASAADI